MKRWLVRLRRVWRRLMRLVRLPAPPPTTPLPPLPARSEVDLLRRRKAEVEERATVYLASIRAANIAGANEVNGE